MRTMHKEDYRVLEAVEIGMKQHALVPAPLIASIAKLRHGGTGKILSSLLRDKLLSHDRSVGYDGYRLTNCGYDILALHALKSRKLVYALGDKIGTGKESDVYLAVSPQGKQFVLKFHRLGRTSFRDVKKKRDYFNAKTRKTAAHSWLFLSRLSALKEYAFMKALYDVGYPTPEPIGHSRHIVAMSLVRGAPLYQTHSNNISAAQAESIFSQSMSLASRLAAHGLVHCDLNEFNLMVDLSGIQHEISRDNDVGDHYVRHSGGSVSHAGALSAHGPLEVRRMDGTGEIITEKPPEPAERLENGDPKPIVKLIDFPQMVSTKHPNAKELFERDVHCLQRFFEMKLKCVPGDGWDSHVPRWEDMVQESSTEDADGNVVTKAQSRLDADLKASGFSDNDSNRDMELYYFNQNPLQSKNNTLEEGDEEAESASEDEDVCDSASDNEGPEIGRLAVNDGESDEEIDEYQIIVEAEEKARVKVRQHMNKGKQNMRKKGAFATRNYNKTYHRGKRVGKPDLSY